MIRRKCSSTASNYFRADQFNSSMFYFFCALLLCKANCLILLLLQRVCVVARTILSDKEQYRLQNMQVNHRQYTLYPPPPLIFVS